MGTLRFLVCVISVILRVGEGVLKAGFLFVGAPQDFGWNFQQNKARIALEHHFSGQLSTIYETNVSEFGVNVCDFCADMPGWNSSRGAGGCWNDEPEHEGSHAAAVIMRRWIEEEGVQIVFATSFFYQGDAYHMAIRYPHIYFVHAGGWMTLPNLAPVFPKVYEARYLSGIVLGWYLKKHGLPKRVGYISAFPLGETVRALNAFKLGLEQVDPEIEVFLIWMMAWHAPRTEAIFTSRLIEFYGVEGLAQHTDDPGIQHAAHSYNKVGVGYNSDGLYIVGDSVLTSSILDWFPDYANLIQQAINQNWQPYQSLWNRGSWRLGDFSPLVPKEAIAQIEALQSSGNDGLERIFCRPDLRDNKGRLRNVPGQPNPTQNPPASEVNHLKAGTTCLTDAVVLQSCQVYRDGQCIEHWLLEGIHDSCNTAASLSTGLSDGVCFLGISDLPDKCSDGKHLTLLGCVPASPGYYAKNEKQLPCPLGYEAPGAGHVSCLPCQAGKVAGATNMSHCIPCSSGTYTDLAGLIECRLCAPGTFATEVGSTACVGCDIGKFSASSASTSCDACVDPRATTAFLGAKGLQDCICVAGTFVRPDAQGARCEDCPEGMSCRGGRELPILLEGFWASVHDPFVAMRCTTTTSCPGGAVREDVCGQDLSGFLCAQCEQHHYQSYGMGNCVECGTLDWAPMLLVLLAFLMLPLGLHLFFARGKAGKAASQALIFSVLVGQLIAYSQIFAVLGSLDTDWPPEVSWVFVLCRLMAFKFSLLRPACLFGDWSFELQFLSGIMVPVVFAGLYGIGVAASFALARLRILRVPADADLALSTSGRVGMIFHVAILKQATKIFECYSHPNGQHSIIEFPAILCFESRHNVMIPFAILMILVYCVGLTGVLCWLVYVAPNKFSEKIFCRRYGFLLLKFRPDRWYWSIPCFVRNTLLCFVVIVVPDYPVLQLMAFNLIMVLFLAATLNCTPWRDPKNNTLEVTLAMVLVVFSLAALPLLGYDDRIVTALTVMMVLSLVAEAGIILHILIAAVRENCKFSERTVSRIPPTCVGVQVIPERPPLSDAELHSRIAATVQSVGAQLGRKTLIDLDEVVSKLTKYDQKLIQSFVRLMSIECNLSTPGAQPTRAWRLKTVPDHQTKEAAPPAPVDRSDISIVAMPP